MIIKRTAGDISLEDGTVGDWEDFSDRHFGGEGADTFQVEIDQVSSTQFQFVNDDQEDSQRLLSLFDFTAGEDVLDLTFVDMPIVSVNLVETETGTRVEFIYEHIIFDADPASFEDDLEVGDTALVSAYIFLGDTNVTMDDIVMNNEPAA